MIKWNKVRCYTLDRTEYIWMNPHIPYNSGEIFLRQILEMSKENKRSISFEASQNLFIEAYHEFCLTPGVSFEEVQCMFNNMVSWLSSRGYYIELDHTEYTGLTDPQ